MNVQKILSVGATTLICIVFVVCIGAAILVAWNLTMQNKDIELGDRVKNFGAVAAVGVAAISSLITALVGIRNVAVQMKATADVATATKLLEARIAAYKDMHAAALNYYRLLAPLETGTFDYSLFEPGESKMKEAESGGLFVTDEYQGIWTEFWHTARNLKENVHQNAPDGPTRIGLWRASVKNFGALLREMKRLAGLAPST